MQREELELTDGPEWTLDQNRKSERRATADRKLIGGPAGLAYRPSDEQLALFAKRVRRAIRDEGSRVHIFGIASGEGDFSGYPDVLRTLEWIEGLANS